VRLETLAVTVRDTIAHRPKLRRPTGSYRDQALRLGGRIIVSEMDGS
jgi:hypothetical protein